jgi:Zn-dependent protease
MGATQARPASSTTPLVAPDTNERMGATVRIARIAGIDLEAHWSWLFVVALVVWSLADAVFPSTNPDLGSGTYVAMGVVAALALCVSLGAHELGHALRARREGMRIDGITLWLLGGIARFGGRFPSAGAELRIALAGPVVSLLIGGVLLVFALLAPLPAAVDGVVFWLGYVNLVLAGFNLLPALPLDGGRVLRAALWARRGVLGDATHAAVVVSRAIGRAMIVGGVVLLLFGFLGGAWLALIGWFVLSAASREELIAPSGRLAHVHVEDVMVRAPHSVRAGTTLDRFLEEVVFSTRHTVYPVLSDVDGGGVIGLISFRDAQRIRRADRRAHVVEEQMVPLERVLMLSPGALLVEQLGALTAAPLRRALVRDHGRVVGLLSPSDALRVVDVLKH